MDCRDGPGMYPGQAEIILLQEGLEEKKKVSNCLAVDILPYLGNSSFLKQVCYH